MSAPDHPELAGLHRVIGPPGCGKTTHLARQCARAVERYGERGVLVASLTRAAAHEVAGRHTGLHRDQVGTLHAHAYRALERPELAETPDALKEWNAAHPTYAVKTAARDRDNLELRESYFFDEEAGGQALLQRVGVHRARLDPPTLWADEATPVGRFHAAWEAWKRETHRLDFSDLIEVASREVDAPAGRPAVLMLDEAQDVSALEMRLAAHWAKSCKMMVIVGDPDQCLYTWRGSDPSVFNRDDAVWERILADSYRVPATVHALATSWIRRWWPERRDVEYHPRDADGSVEMRPGWVHSETRRLVEDVESADGTRMVLATCGYMLDDLIRELRERGVPFHNPYRATNGAWNPLRGGARVLAFLRPAMGGEPWSWRDVWSWVEPMRAPVFERGFKARLEHRAKEARGAERDRGAEPADLDLLARSMPAEAWQAIVASDLDWYEAALLEPARRRLEYSLTVCRRRGVQGLVEEPKVIVGTIHSVKGGEADHVYVYRDLSRSACEGWERRGDGRASVVRAFYVAYTRARERLVVCGATNERMAVPAPVALP